MYECFHCGARAVIWDADFNFEDYGLEGEGIIHLLEKHDTFRSGNNRKYV